MTTTDELKRAGFVCTPSGDTLLSGAAAQLFGGWQRFLHAQLRPFFTSECLIPASIERDTLRTSGYLDHFPQQLMEARSAIDDGADARCMTPAACLHLYPQLRRGRTGLRPVNVLISGRCVRYEGGQWKPPFRLSTFLMTELVCVGPQQMVASVRDALEQRITQVFADIRMAGSFKVATDAFFLSSNRGARLVQKLKGLKREFTVTVDTTPVALASVNLHEDYFGRRFEIMDGAGQTAWSCCAAFGIERLTAYGLLTWGGDPVDWPDPLRS